MNDANPTFPPLLKGIATEPDGDPFQVARRAAQTGAAGAGDVYWSPSEQRLAATLVLEPEVVMAEALEANYIALVAFGDCLGALAPPEVGVNEAAVGELHHERLAAPGRTDDARLVPGVELGGNCLPV